MHNHLIGKTLTEAKEYLDLYNVRYRISSVDNKQFVLTADYAPSRVNLSVENGVVSDIYNG